MRHSRPWDCGCSGRSCAGERCAPSNRIGSVKGGQFWEESTLQGFVHRLAGRTVSRPETASLSTCDAEMPRTNRVTSASEARLAGIAAEDRPASVLREIKPTKLEPGLPLPPPSSCAPPVPMMPPGAAPLIVIL